MVELYHRYYHRHETAISQSDYHRIGMQLSPCTVASDTEFRLYMRAKTWRRWVKKGLTKSYQWTVVTEIQPCAPSQQPMIAASDPYYPSS
jgi:hypothetical protein